MKSKDSWKDLFDTLELITSNRGKITDWAISQKGTWAKDTRRITIDVELVDIETVNIKTI